jgi:hypothetical protein
MREIRTKMTRLKLAQEDDMHTGFVSLTDKGDGKHYRYGYSGSFKDEQTGKIVRITAEERKSRFQNRLKYKSILGGIGYNEIVVAYRHHNSGIFPLFVNWPATTKMDALTKGDAAYQFPVISSDGVLTGQNLTNGGTLV